VKTKTVFSILVIIQTALNLFADSRQFLDKPLMLGPQYPLLFMSTSFEPDTAFLIEQGDWFFSSSYTLLNTYVFSSNSMKADDSSAPASSFQSSDSEGYSVYMDGELDRRFFKLHYGFSDNIELQLTYRDFRFFQGSLDASIEGFHETLGIDNQGRDKTDQDLLEIYIHDNETGENVFVITESSSSFHQESVTLGLKINLQETASEAISFSLSSNFGDYYIERDINESTSDAQRPEHGNFNDYNLTLRYSSLFDAFTIHAAFSMSFVQDSLLEKSPDIIYFFFVGSNWHISDNWDLILQGLEYSSPFPKDKSTINDDIREISTGLRWYLYENTVMEIGLTENQSQGPQNIDIAFFSNLMIYL
jgi:Protein of unknown function (DUF3187)